MSNYGNELLLFSVGNRWLSSFKSNSQYTEDTEPVFEQQCDRFVPRYSEKSRFVKEYSQTEYFVSFQEINIFS